MRVLVDTSIWIDYFRGGGHSDKLDYMIDENIVVTNDPILAELVPLLKVRNHTEIISLLNSVERFKLEIDWNQIIEYQLACLLQGINGIGIPDLIIAQNAIQNHCEIFSMDNHFRLMRKVINLTLTER
ncbi:PIN domain-containing protein [bacterium]|nr:PIN domain-containing protein [bacterium]